MPGSKDKTIAGKDLLEFLRVRLVLYELRKLHAVCGLVNGEASVHNNTTSGFVLISLAIDIILCSAE